MKFNIKQSVMMSMAAATLILPLQAGAWWGPYSYGPGYSNWGPFDGFGDMDLNFSFRGNARSMFNGNGFNRAFYGYPYYGPMPVAYAAPVPSPVEPVKTAPADGDADGVADKGDLCPDSTAGAQVDALGCELDAAIVLRGVNFHTDSDQLTDESLAILDGVAVTLTANPGIRVQVAGHTDDQGDDAYNKDLSQRRAATVVGYLVGKGVAGDNLQPAGYGEEQPVADNTTSVGRAENRRVELVRLDG